MEGRSFMKNILVAAALVVAATSLAPASAWDTHLTSDPSRKERDSCGPTYCGKTQCYDKKNKPWVCKTDTGKKDDCYWHSSGLCLNKYQGKDLKAGDDVTGKFPSGE
jgi:hypothetical protein